MCPNAVPLIVRSGTMKPKIANKLVIGDRVWLGGGIVRDVLSIARGERELSFHQGAVSISLDEGVGAIDFLGDVPKVVRPFDISAQCRRSERVFHATDGVIVLERHENAIINEACGRRRTTAVEG